MAGVLTTVGFRDSRGKIARVRFFVAAGTPANESTQAGAVVTALAGLSNAQQATSHGAFNQSPSAVIYGARSTYENAEDKLVITYQSAVGSIHRLQVPAPLSTVFLADGMTMDPTNVLVTALGTATIGIITDANGNALTTLVAGVRVRRKNQRKITIFSLTPVFGPEE